MHRSTIDKLISSMGLVGAAILLVASGGLFFAQSFVHEQVEAQLRPQKIMLPAKDSESFKALSETDQQAIGDHAGQQVVNGVQARIFADHYIAAHLQNIGGGKTYAEVSAASMADPSDAALAAKTNTIFKGETLRGMLLNAYAFDTMATVAFFGAIGTLVAGVLLAILSAFGFRHAKKVTKKKK